MCRQKRSRKSASPWKTAAVSNDRCWKPDWPSSQFIASRARNAESDIGKPHSFTLRPPTPRPAAPAPVNAELALRQEGRRRDKVERELRKTIAKLEKENRSQAKLIKKLMGQLAKNSDNSSKPPSSAGLAKPPPKPVNQRAKTGRSSGGQPGHKGRNLPFKELGPDDQSIEHRPPDICPCGHQLCGLPATLVTARQVIDLPPILAPTVTEHRVLAVVCPGCAQQHRGQFPEQVKAHTSYGPGICSLVIFFACEQYIPLERLAATLKGVFGIKLSQGSIVKHIRRCARQLKLPLEAISAQLIADALLHVDETGVRVEGKLHWLHVMSTKRLTYFFLHGKRGADAITAQGLLPLFKGFLVHDFWKPYFDLKGVRHCMCVAHLLRELKFAHEQDAQAWAEQMITLLVEAHNAAKDGRAAGRQQLPAELMVSFRSRYLAILAAGRRQNQLPEGPIAPGVRGAPQSKSVNLLSRFANFRTEIFRFAEDLQIPFDNNLAERDIRMAKLRQKISGTFRNEEQASAFYEIRSYLSTARKQGADILAAIRGAFTGAPFMPAQANAPP